VVGSQGVSTFSVEQTPVTDSRVLDIDDDGIRDVLKAQAVFEQGRGYETFLTWFRWDGRRFAPHETTNIVRNLNTFLRLLEEHLADGNLSQFLTHALPPEAQAGGSPAGGTADLVERRETAGSLFRREDETAVRLETLLEEFELASVAFPEFLENPFPDPGYRTSVTAPVRIDTVAGNTFYYRADIVMSENPFTGKQFWLAPQ
jgi:hypothetical protein